MNDAHLTVPAAMLADIRAALALAAEFSLAPKLPKPEDLPHPEIGLPKAPKIGMPDIPHPQIGFPPHPRIFPKIGLPKISLPWF